MAGLTGRLNEVGTAAEAIDKCCSYGLRSEDRIEIAMAKLEVTTTEEGRVGTDTSSRRRRARFFTSIARLCLVNYGRG